jgi:hypothetical protein
MKVNLSNGRELHVRIVHEQYPESLPPRPGKKYPIRAVTTVLITENEGVVGFAHSFCALMDQFVRRDGVVRALKRALMGFSRPERGEIFRRVLGLDKRKEDQNELVGA